LNLYVGVPHGFGVQVKQSIPHQANAKEASFVQAATYFDVWLYFMPFQRPNNHGMGEW
jgi:hypothetical protein